VPEYCQQQVSASSTTTVSPQQALEHLTRNHWNKNNNTLVQFVAIRRTNDDDKTGDFDWLERTNHVVGAVDLVLPLQTSQPENSYYYLKNLRVHQHVRKQGIGSALVQQVLTFATKQQQPNKQQQTTTRVVLTTTDQHHLYARHGFVRQPDGTTMIWEEP
jgi:predicted N-acetyltransferase YhbS